MSSEAEEVRWPDHEEGEERARRPSEEGRAQARRYVVKLLAAFDASDRDVEELLVLARRCPACSAELNVRATAAFREVAHLLPPAFPLGTVQCRRHERKVCGELVLLTAEDVQRARSR